MGRVSKDQAAKNRQTVVEGAAKTLSLRLKARGAWWRHKNARAMAAQICCRQTDQWDLFWKRAA